MATQTVLNVTYQPIQINAAGQVLASRQPYLYDDATISAPDFSIIQKHIAAGRLQIITSGVSLPAPTDGAVLTSVKIQGANLVFTDSSGATTNVPLPSGGGDGGSVDLTAYVRTSDLTTKLTAKADAASVYDRATLDSLIGGKALAANVYSRSEIDSKLAATGSTSSNVVLLEQSNGYCPPGSTSPVVSPAANTSYRFHGLATPPFGREQDLWVKVDRGIVASPVTLTLVSSDDFDGGKNLATPASAPLDANKWGGDNTYFRQSIDGLFVPTGWDNTLSRRYIAFDKTQAVSARMRAQFTSVGYSSTSVVRALQVAVNVTAPTVSATVFTGYYVTLSTTSAGSTEDWAVIRYENGVGVATFGQETRTRSGNPRNVIVESNGNGGITVTVDGVILNGGKPFNDPSTTPLTGQYAGLGGYGQSSFAAASMNAKGEAWKLYA